MRVPARRPSSLAVALLTLNALLLPFCLFGLHGSDTDVFYHLAAGRWMAENGRVLGHESFSFLAEGRPWTNYYWAFERALFGAFAAGGFAGVIALRSVLVLATANLFVWWVHRQAGGALLETLAFGLLVLPIYLSRALDPRPHLASYLLLLAGLVLLDAFRRGRRAAGLLLVLACVAWANLHGVEYPVVLSAVALHAADALRPDFRRGLRDALRDPRVLRWPVLLLSCAAAFLVNPFGARLLATPLIAADVEVMAQIVEMRPIPLRSLGNLFPDLVPDSGVAFRYAALAGLALVPGWVRRRDVLAGSFYALGLGLALHKQRFVIEFLILAVPFVARGVAEARRRPGRPRPWVTALLCGLVGLLVAGALTTLRTYARAGHLEPVSTILYPHGAVRFIDRHGLGGNLHCDPTLAGYVTWHLHPRVRVGMDMRTPEPFAAGDLWLANAMGAAVPLDRVSARWPVDLVLLHREAPLAARLRGDGSYAPVYADPWFILFAHRRALTAGRADLPLQALGLMEELEAGRFPAPGGAAPRLRLEAQRLTDAWDMNNLGHRALLWLLVAEGRFAEARQRALDLERRYPRQGLYAFFDGLALNGLGQAGPAAEAFRRALLATPHFPPASAALAETLLLQGRPEEARAAMQESAHGRWTSLTAGEYVLLGRASLATGRAREAVDAFERAAWLQPPGSPGHAEAEALRAQALRALQGRGRDGRGIR